MFLKEFLNLAAQLGEFIVFSVNFLFGGAQQRLARHHIGLAFIQFLAALGEIVIEFGADSGKFGIGIVGVNPVRRFPGGRLVLGGQGLGFALLGSGFGFMLAFGGGFGFFMFCLGGGFFFFLSMGRIGGDGRTAQP
ncbi:MAG: hypothetical protein DYH13_06340 [Alphaproteobacteria bacterium PRO2]|nr:hypothetical protein [Alphaproteobacteria bacterium PRO2]